MSYLTTCLHVGGVVHIKEGNKISRYTHILFDYLLIHVGGVVHIKEGDKISRYTHILLDYLLICRWSGTY